MTPIHVILLGALLVGYALMADDDTDELPKAEKKKEAPEEKAKAKVRIVKVAVVKQEESVEEALDDAPIVEAKVEEPEPKPVPIDDQKPA